MSRTVVNQELNEQEIRVNRENILIGGGAVNSVNGQTGDVVLTAQDVGAASTTELGNEVEARIAADNGLQSQIDGLAAASDVTDIVGTYADLQAYDTSKLNDNDIIKVLQDEQHDDETTYYRWSTDTEQFTLIGEEGPYYTKSAADTKFQEKLVAGTNITIDPSTNEISASASGLSDSTTFWGRTASNGKVGGKLDVKYSENDTSYVTITPTNTHSMSITQTSGGSTHTLINVGASNTPATFYDGINVNNKKITNVATPTDTTDAANKDYVDGLIPSDFTGTDGVDAGTHGLVPAPTAADVDKFLKSDGTWATAGGGGTSDLPVYNVKMSELNKESYSGATWFSLSSGGYGKTGIYYVTNDLAETATNCRIAIWNPSEVDNSTDRGVVCWMGAGNLNVRVGETIGFSIWRGARSSSYKEQFLVRENPWITTSNSTRAAQRFGVLTFATSSSTVPTSVGTVYSEAQALSIASNVNITGSYASSMALGITTASDMYKTILGTSSLSITARSWTAIGTGSNYTRRALQTILNVKETGLTLTANDWNTLFTMGSGWRPTVEMIVGCTILDNGSYASSILKITTGGAVQVMAGSSTTEVYGFVIIPAAS